MFLLSPTHYTCTVRVLNLRTIFGFSEFPFTPGIAVPISFLIKKHPTVFFNRFPLWLVLAFEMDMTLRDL